MPEFRLDLQAVASDRWELKEMIDLRGKSPSGRRRPVLREASEPTAGREPKRISLRIRRVRPADVTRVVALDRRVTGLAKTRYWQDVFRRYGKRRPRDRFFLIAEPLGPKSAPRLFGFIIGEVRAWEFGSSPCGWIFALSVEPGARLHGIGEALFNAISAEFSTRRRDEGTYDGRKRWSRSPWCSFVVREWSPGPISSSKWSLADCDRCTDCPYRT